MAENTKRHPSVEHLLQFFTVEHLPPALAVVAGDCAQLAHAMAATLPNNPELTVGLRKLLEAKDCFVRASLGAAKEDPQPSTSGQLGQS